MADTTINPPSSSLKLYYRVARFAWQSGEQYLCFTSDHYFRLPSSHIYETCENFICWETEWIALPAHRSAAEAASVSILSSGELCSGEVAANERSESATGPKLSYTHTTNHTESATPLSSHSTSHTYRVNDESATGSPVPAEDTCVSDSEESAPIYYTQQVRDDLDTLQAICAQALVFQTDTYASSCSCQCLVKASYLAVPGTQTEDDIAKDYRNFSNARISEYGFHHISGNHWKMLMEKAKQTYRLEMLYYFWLANQDGMDAFS